MGVRVNPNLLASSKKLFSGQRFKTFLAVSKVGLDSRYYLSNGRKKKYRRDITTAAREVNT